MKAPSPSDSPWAHGAAAARRLRLQTHGTRRLQLQTHGTRRLHTNTHSHRHATMQTSSGKHYYKYTYVHILNINITKNIIYISSKNPLKAADSGLVMVRWHPLGRSVCLCARVYVHVRKREHPRSVGWLFAVPDGGGE